MVLAALLQNFLRTGAKTCEEISAYMEKARTHQFIRIERDGNWLIQQLCVERMLHFLLSAGQFH